MAEKQLEFDFVKDLDKTKEHCGCCLDDFEKDWRWWDWLEHYWYVYFWNWFTSIPRNTKYFIQRGKRGWSEEDVWGMHHYLTDVLIGMLTEYRRVKHGYPSPLDGRTGDYEDDMEKWDNILGEMIEGFTILRKVDTCGEHLEYGQEVPDSIRSSMEQSMRKTYPKWRFTTKEEEAKVKRSFDLLFQYYRSLWD